VSETVLPTLDQGLQRGWTISDSIIYAHVTLMAHHPDSLIGRKLGPEVAAQSQEMARRVLDTGPPGSAAYTSSLADLDFWLRSDGHRRNPGTTADLIAAGLFVLLRLGQIPEPIR
jgi:triphosphoribosyl-dephospho-CoA synthase